MSALCGGNSTCKGLEMREEKSAWKTQNNVSMEVGVRSKRVEN